jgi:hypothetical protein
MAGGTASAHSGAEVVAVPGGLVHSLQQVEDTSPE